MSGPNFRSQIGLDSNLLLHLAFTVGVETDDNPAQLHVTLCRLLVNILTCLLTTRPALNTRNARNYLFYKHVQQLC